MLLHSFDESFTFTNAEDRAEIEERAKDQCYMDTGGDAAWEAYSEALRDGYRIEAFHWFYEMAIIDAEVVWVRKEIPSDGVT